MLLRVAGEGGKLLHRPRQRRQVAKWRPSHITPKRQLHSLFYIGPLRRRTASSRSLAEEANLIRRQSGPPGARLSAWPRARARETFVRRQDDARAGRHSDKTLPVSDPRAEVPISFWAATHDLAPRTQVPSSATAGGNRQGDGSRAAVLTALTAARCAPLLSLQHCASRGRRLSLGGGPVPSRGREAAQGQAPRRKRLHDRTQAARP
jgi:hypothetical protein